MSEIDRAELDTCGCCEGAPEEPEHHNPPGLDEIRYRIGTHPELLARMKARIHRWEMLACATCERRFVGADRAREIREHLSEAHGLSGAEAEAQIQQLRPLAGLATRAADDPAIALMDAWAVAGDVLTFYQERIANEAFLRTATERRSVLELARAIGYELDPGVAAEAYLAFTVDDAEGSPATAPVPAGTRVQSIPASQDELPQTFETADELVARVAWNELRPRLKHRQDLSPGVTRVYLEGTATGLEPGDRVLLVVGTTLKPKVVSAVKPDLEAERTRIDLSASPTEPSTSFDMGTPETLDPSGESPTLTRGEVEKHVFEKTWRESDLQAFLTLHEWDADDVLVYVADLLEERLEGSGEIHALREKVRFFGHNAPRWETLPKAENSRGSTASPPSDPYAKSWDGAARTIWEDSQDVPYTEADAYLEQAVSAVVASSWAVLEAPTGSGTKRTPYWIQDVVEATLVDYGLSAKVTGLELTNGKTTSSVTKDAAFKVRRTTAHVASELLELAALPVTDDLTAGTQAIDLGSMVLGLEKGQTIVLEGEELDSAGTTRRELLTLGEITHKKGRTRLEFTRLGSSDEGLAYAYKRDTVKLNANVARASHGETVENEVLGSGDGSAVHQRFELKKEPLTHVGSASASGQESTLTVRVDGVAWTEVSSLYGSGATDRHYVVRIDDDAVPSVTFGDGKRGARLPTGQENVKATYRSGIGSDGEVGKASLTLLKTRPFGIKSVTNPQAASGADDPEKLADARTNAPLTVLTLDRIVSLADYQDFARAYAGIGKAQATEVWDGTAERLAVTVADADGDPVVEPLYGRLKDAIDDARDPLRRVELYSFQPLVFYLQARVRIDDAYLWEDLEPEIESELIKAFSFEQRAFGQPVAAAEVLEVIHGVEGVVAVDLDHLAPTAPTGDSTQNLFNAVLASRAARWDEAAKKVKPAELLLVHPFGIELSEWTS